MNRRTIDIAVAMAALFLTGFVTLSNCLAKSNPSVGGAVSGESPETSSPDLLSNQSTQRSHFTTRDIEAMLIRPVSARELLQNIKTIMKRDLLVEDSFYNDAVLLKAFNGTNVKWSVKRGEIPGAPEWHNISIVVKTTSLQGLKVALSKGKVPNGKQTSRDGEVTERFGASGYLELRADKIPDLTVGLVRDIVGSGREIEDFGNATDGGGVAATSKGFMIFELPRHTSEDGINLARSETIIFVKKTSASNEDPTVPVRRWSLNDSDEIQKLTMSQLER